MIDRKHYIFISSHLISSHLIFFHVIIYLSFRQIKDALYDEEVREHIVTAVKTAKRGGGRGFGASSSGAAAAASKTEGAVEEEQAEAAMLEQASAPVVTTAEAKNIIAEFDALIENIKACLDGNYPAEGDTVGQDGEAGAKMEAGDGEEGPTAAEEPVQPATRGAKKAPVKKGKGAPKKKKARMSYSDDEGDDDDDDDKVVEPEEDNEDEAEDEGDVENTVNRGTSKSAASGNRSNAKTPAIKSKKGAAVAPAVVKGGRTGRLKKISQIALGDDSD